MADQIRVRLVPKTREGESVTMNLAEMTPQLAKRYAPDPGRAEKAHRLAANIGIDAKITRHHSLDGTIPSETFASMFQAELVEKEGATEGHSYRRRKTFLTTTKALEIPDQLKDTIAFAYIPTPPEFLDVSFVPPNVSVYHLRLMDVLRALNGSSCHRRRWTGPNIRVAMTDTGFANHPYFISQGYTIERVSAPSTEHPMIDTVGHGTGESANVLVMAPDCRFIGVKHNDYSAEALETALEQNPHIVTNSWGWDNDYQSKASLKQNNPNLFNELVDVENIINDAIADGVVMIFAAGNGHQMFPASIPNVLAVGGVTVEQNGQLKASSYASSFTSQLYPGRQLPDVCGVVGESGNSPQKGHIMLPVPNGSELEGENMPNSQSHKGWGIFSGTSAATPQTAGVVALLLQINPHLTPNQVKSVLSDTATDVTRGTTALGDNARVGHDRATGAGFVNAFQACLRAESLRVAPIV
jgi:serine protease AprX